MPPPRNLDLFRGGSPPPLLPRNSVSGEVEALAAAWRDGDRADPALRADCERRLARLREAWRVDRGGFAERDLATLREVARLIAAPAAAPARSPQEVLREVFRYETFRPGQEEIVGAVLAGRDCVGVMPTGGGKSLTYQIPARILGGTTLVVSPLIALMKDQVDAMERIGIRATFLNSSVDPEERRRRVQRVRAGAYELVYAAPEGLEASVGAALASVRLSVIAVDEAHCISHWGHDFRPAYRNLRGLKERFGGIPVLALTATATAEVTRDIVEQLGMQEPLVVRGTFFRPNLRLHAYRKGAGAAAAGVTKGLRARDALIRIVRARRGESGIVYCLSRKAVDGTAELFRAHGVRARSYHAGMDAEDRTRVQDAFQAGSVDVVVATVAFGMGIDKPDIRYVLHRDMPRSVEGYYQEVGRAGRDGKPSDCVLFYSWADVMSWDRLAESSDRVVAEGQRRQARQMFRYAEEASCRHQALVGHFGERIGPCGAACDLCTGEELLATTKPLPRKAAPTRRKRRRPRRG